VAIYLLTISYGIIFININTDGEFMGAYENIAFIMRYFFLALFVILVAGLVLVSFNEYREKKRIMAFAGYYIGFAEVVYSDDEDYTAARFGISIETSIGSSSKSDIIISGNGVLKKHASIVKEKNKVIITPNQNAVVQVNGQKIKAKRTLSSGDIVLIGGTALLIHLKEETV